MLFWGNPDGGPREACVSLIELRKLLTLKTVISQRRHPEIVNRVVEFAAQIALILANGGKLLVDPCGESMEAVWPLLDAVAEWTGIVYDRRQVVAI